MSRDLFDDILMARGLKGLLSPPEMDNAVPKAGSILGGFDYRRPFENGELEKEFFAENSRFAPPISSVPMSSNDIWRAKALSAEFAQKPLAASEAEGNTLAQQGVYQADSWPTVYKDHVTEPWNNPRDGSKNHQGVDFRNFFGEPVFSVSDGMVDEINDNPDGGPEPM